MNECIFCKTIKGEMPATKVYEGDKVLAILDIAPVNKGHALVMSKEHYKNLLEAPAEVLKDLIVAVQKVGAGIVKGLGVEGFNVAINNGRVAGQMIDHLHIHVIPRTLEDNLTLWLGGKYVGEEAEEFAKKIRENIG